MTATAGISEEFTKEQRLLNVTQNYGQRLKAINVVVDPLSKYLFCIDEKQTKTGKQIKRKNQVLARPKEVGAMQDVSLHEFVYLFIQCNVWCNVQDSVRPFSA